MWAHTHPPLSSTITHVHTSMHDHAYLPCTISSFLNRRPSGLTPRGSHYMSKASFTEKKPGFFCVSPVAEGHELGV